MFLILNNTKKVNGQMGCMEPESSGWS